MDTLRVGDAVLTASGEPRTVRWLGHQIVGAQDDSGGSENWPIRIASHAFGPDRPTCDIVVSPRLAIGIDLIGPILIQAFTLVNGASIARIAPHEREFWHVALDGSDVLSAAGLAFESHLDGDEFRFFLKGESYPIKHADRRLDFMGEAGVTAVRERILARASAIGWRKDEASFAGLCIHADGVLRPRVESGLVARFTLDAEPRDVWLISESTVPAFGAPGAADRRRLGVCLQAITIEDDARRRSIALDDPLLADGLHDMEDGCRRWTTGRTHLPASLFEGSEGTIVIEVALTSPALPRWREPPAEDTRLDGNAALSVHAWSYEAPLPSLEQGDRSGFLSHAQNFEDVMLWRALGHIKNGFYIDVGACSPTVDSVTAAFYERGWAGINIEPIKELHEQLKRRRPKDVNLRVCLGESIGQAVLWVVPDTGLSTLDASIAEVHQASGKVLQQMQVDVRTLADVCHEHVDGPVHFLKVDVEGAERDVLAGADFATFRPWIVLLEATLPNSQALQHAAWEDLLLAAHYRFVWFDGLNRFYIASEHHASLQHAFLTPVNIFDHVKLSPLHQFSLSSP